MVEISYYITTTYAASSDNGTTWNTVLTHSWQYDAYNRATSNGVSTQSYNTANQVTAKTTPNNYDWQFTYDAVGQVKTGKRYQSTTLNRTDSYNYDLIGNHLGSGYTMTNVNRQTNLTYDADGNMLNDGTYTYTWDGENRLETLYDGHLSLTFSYDYANRRYKTAVIGTNHAGMYWEGTYNYIYNGTKMITKLYDGDVQKTYAWHSASGHPDSIAWSNVEFYGCGLNKNVYAKYNQSGVKTKSYDYDAFGNMLLGVLIEDCEYSDHDFLYSSEYTDSWGFVHYLYRTYKPAHKRFIQEDPIEEQGGNNLYGFVGNNPVNRWDNNGLISEFIPIMDMHGQIILQWWLDGSGEPRIIRDDYMWSDYMMANEKLRRQNMSQLLAWTNNQRIPSGKSFAMYEIKYHAEIENGYTTGYEMLHGTHRGVGDFKIFVGASFDKKGDYITVEYDAAYVWNDIIDPNFKYDNDVILSENLKRFYNPKDYNIHIHWREYAEICYQQSNGEIIEFSGYPFESLEKVYPISPYWKIELRRFETAR